MKFQSARELLLARHVSASVDLDRIRAQVIATASPVKRGLSSAMSPRVIFVTLWREVFWPCRKTWLTLAGVWVMLAAVHWNNLRQSESGPVQMARSADLEQLWQQWQEQRRMLAGLIPPDPVKPPPALPGKLPKTEIYPRQSSLFRGWSNCV